ncbi:MAG: hypothetical protein HQK92_10115 [Nitrospirae bacterium]|nr:hypothetical protein [Nitrospirota bacterium]
MALVYYSEKDVRYIQGIEKGKLEGIHLSLDIKFGSEGVSLMNTLNNIEKLGEMKKIIKDTESVVEFKNKVKMNG